MSAWKISMITETSIIEQTGILKIGNNSMPINGLPPGIYMLVLTDNEGVKTVRKIAKE